MPLPARVGLRHARQAEKVEDRRRRNSSARSPPLGTAPYRRRPAIGTVLRYGFWLGHFAWNSWVGSDHRPPDPQFGLVRNFVITEPNYTLKEGR